MGSAKSLAKIFGWNAAIVLILLSPIWIPLSLTWLTLNHLNLVKKVPAFGQWSIQLARYPYLNYFRPGLNGRKDCYAYDEILLYRGKPNSECRFSGLEFDTKVAHNSFGVRSLDSDLLSPSTIVIGDSHAMGWGVDQGERFSELLPLRFQPVLNLAVSSYGTARELRLLDLYAAQFPDAYTNVSLVILQYGVNDFGENISTGSAKFNSARPPEDFNPQGMYAGYRELMWSVSPAQVRQALNHWYAWTAAQITKELGVPGVIPSEWAYDPYAIPYPGHGDPFVQAFAPYSGLLAGKALAVFVSSDHGFYNKSAFDHLLSRRQELQAALPRTELVWVDFSSACSSECYYDLDDHLRPLGHRRLASLLEESIHSR